MKNISSLSVLLLAASTFTTFVLAAAQQGPEPTAIAFMAKQYEVSPNQVTVRIMNKTQQMAIAKADVENGSTCVVRMNKAGQSEETPNGWAVIGSDCNTPEED